MTTPTVHDLAAQFTRERARAVALVNKLENIGVKPSKRLTDARAAQAAHSRLLAEKRRDAATVEHEITEAAAAGHWGALTDAAERMSLAAAVLDTVDGVEDEAPAYRYGRNLLHPAAADRSPIVGGPSMLRADGDLVRVGENITAFAAGWEWLGSPEVAPLRPWIDLATADARPGERVGIAYDPDAERADAATFADMAAAHGSVQSSKHNVGTRAGYATAWWTQRQG
ncbi:hypothetical protein GQ85_12575 [Rhodococcus rhodochrous]|nr:hypothetical protein GQ85_12575 [Rhodococcus rhodochrous]